MAMGGAGAAYHFPGFESYYNPALLVHQPALSLTGSFYKPYPFFPNMVRGWSSVDFAIPGVGFFAASMNMYWKARQAFINESGFFIVLPEGEDVSDYLFSWQAKVSYAITIKPDLFLGVSLGYLTYNVFEMIGSGVGTENRDGSTSGFSVDLGVHYLILDRPALFRLKDTDLPEIVSNLGRKDQNYGFTAGLSLLNFGPDLSFIDDVQADAQPSMILLGFSIPVLTSNYLELDVLTDLEKQLHEESSLDFIRSGAELTLYQILKLRGGYVLDTSQPTTSFGTWGMGLHTRYFSIQFSSYEATFLPTWHYDLTLFLEL
jgi:hypothetical protein